MITLRKPTFDPCFIDAHYAFLAELRASGQLEQAGPFADRSGGAYVLLANSVEKAWATAGRDPLHRHDCSAITVHEWDSN